MFYQAGDDNKKPVEKDTLHEKKPAGYNLASDPNEM